MKYYLSFSSLTRRLSFGLLLGLLPLGLTAQTAPGVAPAAPASLLATISGTTLDGTTQAGLPFATVLLRRVGADTSLVATTMTTAEGEFTLAKVPAGAFRLRVLALGYGPLSRAVQVLPGQTAASLGNLALHPTAQALGEVQVTAEKATVQNTLGKRVINVEKDLASVGGVATDVLRNVPSVAVDAGGVVSLRGSSNLTILIDGKPAGTSNGGPGGVRLDQIPASRIAQIEVMTNPSAKYDAQGTGVINIILKKQTKPGANGQLGLTGGTGDKYGATVNLSRHAQKATWNLSYDHLDHTYRSRTSTTQTARPEAAAALVQTSQTGSSREQNINHTLHLGLDYELTKEQSLSLSIEPNWQRERNVGSQLLTTLPATGPATTQSGEQRLNVDVKVLENTAVYHRSWAQHPGRDLTAAAVVVLVDVEAPITQTLTSGALAGWQQQNAVRLNVSVAQLDYVHPLANKGTLETGFRVKRQGSDGVSDLLSLSAEHPGQYQRDAARSVAYAFAETVPAAYATYSQPWGRGWQAQGGLRTEYTHTRGAVNGGQGAFALDYAGLFPSLTVSRGLGRADSASGGAQPQKLQFSYARRLNRPDFMQQLAVPLYQDPRFYRLGNPTLRAEFSHNLELGHELNLSGGAAFTTTLFARVTTGSIQRLRGVDTVATRANPGAGLVLAETYRNFGTTTHLGLEMTWSQPLTKWWRVSANGSVYRAQLQTNALAANARHNWAADVNLNQNFQPTAGLDVQLTANLRSATLTAQGRNLANGGLDLALRQRLFDNRAALTFRVSDVLNTRRKASIVDGADLTASYYEKPETRVAWLGFTWFMGASKAKAGKIEAGPGGGGGFGK